MTITTKYDAGQVVYYVDRAGLYVLEFEIVKINFSIEYSRTGMKIKLMYQCSSDGGWAHEPDLFPTRAAAEAEIKRRKNP